MSQERWDVVLRVLEGPLALQGELVCRGPVVRLGANPGPGGLKLSAYRGLEDRQAVVSAYDGATISLAPVGTAQVRMAPHPNVDWDQIQPLRGPTYLTKDCAFHLGPVGRGVTLQFLDCRRLGEWERQNLMAEAAAANPQVEASEIKELRTNRKVPPWFIGGMIAMGLLISVAVLVPTIQGRKVSDLGPVDEGLELYEVVTPDIAINTDLLEGFDQAFDYFVQKPNADVAKRPDFRTRKENWDTTLLEWTTRSAQQHIKAQKFWGRLDAIADQYAAVVSDLRDAELPEVFAAIPYQESRYRADIQSPVCAKGYWQFMPEVAKRVGIQVSGCKLSGRVDNWAPDRLTPVRGVLKNSVYIRDEQCIIPATRGCAVDERVDLSKSTRGAIIALKEAFEDAYIQESGAAVQITIASHNAGYDDARFDAENKKITNLLPAYKLWLEQQRVEYDPSFIGKQIKCTTNEYSVQDRCGSMLHRETQHYVYPILAQHFLAVCYYATNYSDREEFRPWRDFVTGDGYCTRINVPTIAEAKKWQ